MPFLTNVHYNGNVIVSYTYIFIYVIEITHIHTNSSIINRCLSRRSEPSFTITFAAGALLDPVSIKRLSTSAPNTHSHTFISCRRRRRRRRRPCHQVPTAGCRPIGHARRERMRMFTQHLVAQKHPAPQTAVQQDAIWITLHATWRRKLQIPIGPGVRARFDRVIVADPISSHNIKFRVRALVAQLKRAAKRTHSNAIIRVYRTFTAWARRLSSRIVCVAYCICWWWLVARQLVKVFTRKCVWAYTWYTHAI